MQTILRNPSHSVQRARHISGCTHTTYIHDGYRAKKAGQHERIGPENDAVRCIGRKCVGFRRRTADPGVSCLGDSRCVRVYVCTATTTEVVTE